MTKSFITHLRQCIYSVTSKDANEAADLIERQAAQIKQMRWAIKAVKDRLDRNGISGKQLPEYTLLEKTLSTTPDQALEQFAANVRDQVIEACSDGTGAAGNLLPLSTVAKIRAIKEIP